MSGWVHIGPSTGYYVLVPAESARGRQGQRGGTCALCPTPNACATHGDCLHAVNHAAERGVANHAAAGMLGAGGVAK